MVERSRSSGIGSSRAVTHAGASSWTVEATLAEGWCAGAAVAGGSGWLFLRRRTETIGWIAGTSVLLLMGCLPPHWSAGDEIQGSSVVRPGEVTILQFSSTVQKGRASDMWIIGFGGRSLGPLGGWDASDSDEVSLTVSVVGSSGEEVEADWWSDREGDLEWDWAVIDLDCGEGVLSCERVGEVDLRVVTEEEVTLDWLAATQVWGDGRPGCVFCGGHEEVNVSMRLVE